jgi:hypothetical protein
MDDILAWILLIILIPYGVLSWRFTLWSEAQERTLEKEEKQFFQGNINLERYSNFQQDSYAHLGRLQMQTFIKLTVLGVCAIGYLLFTHSLSVYALTIVFSILWFWSKNIDVWVRYHGFDIQAKQSIYEFIIHRQS